jgi:hypothetical protein
MPDSSVWSAIAETNRGGDPVTVSVQGTDDTGTGVGSSGTIQISFANDDLHGGLYYWTTSSGTAIMRYDFASSTQTSAQRFLDGTATGTSCVGCHALSHDGAKLVAEVQGQSDGRTILWDVADGGAVVPFPSPAKSIFESWNPDGSAYAAVGAELGSGYYPLRIIDGNTGAVSSTISGTGDSSHPADHPDWSPLGNQIVYVKIGDMTASGGAGSSGGTSQRMHAGAIELINKLGDGGWSAPTELVPEVAGKNHYYPAFDPEGQFIVYDESTCLGDGDGTDISCNADTDPTATLFALPLDGGSPIELVNANKPGPLDLLSDGGVQTQLTDSFPKWSPFVTQRSKDPSSKVMWVTFSSSRRFGAYAPPSGSGEAMLGTETFVWMAAIDPAKIGTGEDPSYPAFVLPFQDFTTSNHIAQWAQQVLGGQCVAEGEACDPNGSVGAGTACCDGLTCAPPQQGEITDICQVILN